MPKHTPRRRLLYPNPIQPNLLKYRPKCEPLPGAGFLAGNEANDDVNRLSIKFSPRAPFRCRTGRTRPTA
jgi:hypothetical protein